MFYWEIVQLKKTLKAYYCCHYHFSAFCHDGQLRLVGGTDAREGRVEICFNETWGAICDDAWDDLDANVACSSLGYTRFSMLSFISIIHYKNEIIGKLTSFPV